MQNKAGRQETVDNRYAVSPATIDAAKPARAGIENRFPTTYPYAGFWRRTGGYLIDYILSILLAGMIGAVVGSKVGRAAPIVALASIWLYYALMESSARQGTLGKMAMGLSVTDISGQRVSFGRASGRFFAKIITGLIPFGIGYIMAGFTEKKQALHDMIASCLVMKKV